MQYDCFRNQKASERCDFCHNVQVNVKQCELDTAKCILANGKRHCSHVTFSFPYVLRPIAQQAELRKFGCRARVADLQSVAIVETDFSTLNL